MKLTFDWSHSFCEEKKEWRGDEEIISLEIFQKECGFAIAKIAIGAQNPEKLFNKKYAKIGIQKHEKTVLLFSGRLITFPVGFNPSTMELEFISEPEDYQSKLSEFSSKNFDQYSSVNKHTENESNIYFDDLFFSSRDFKNPTIFLEGSNKIFYWNMKNGELSLSDINGGKKNFDVTGNEILQDSIRVRIAREPYSRINLKISTSWIQYEYGIIDILPMIAEKFDSRIINSLTNIKHGIENIFSERNGYKLIHCNIKEINPNLSGILSQYPISSPDFYIQEKQNKKKVTFKRFYFDGRLIVGWSYRQKRTETVNIEILNESSQHGREKNIYLKLNAIQSPKKYPTWNYFTYYECSDKVQYSDSIFECTSSHVSSEFFEIDKWKMVQKTPDAIIDDTTSSFFSTPRGKNAIKYAMQKAIALVNYSSRHIEIDFCVDAKNFIFASLDDQITIHDKRFQNGHISGKITKIRFSGNANHKIIKFTIGCCSVDLSKNFEKLNSYAIEMKEENCNIQPADIVRAIEIKNSPEEQIFALSQVKAGSVSELRNALNPTKIKLSLHPLNTTRVINREITLPNFEMEKS